MVSEITRVQFLRGYFYKRFSKVIPNKKIVETYVNLAVVMAQVKKDNEHITENRVYKVKSKVYGMSHTKYLDNEYKYDLKYIVNHFLYDYKIRQNARIQRA